MTVKFLFLLPVPSVLLVFCFATGSEHEGTTALQASTFSCVDPDRFYDHIVWTRLESVNHLFCPLDNQSLQLLQSASEFDIVWSKDCHPLHFIPLGHLNSTLQNTTAYLTFESPNTSDAGNYTCTLYLNGQRNASFTVHLDMADLCSVFPRFLNPTSNVTLERALGSQLTLNCTVQLPFSRDCDFDLHWIKDSHRLDNKTHTASTHWFNDNATEIFVSSTLKVNVTDEENYGVFACLLRNKEAVFTLQKSETAEHLGAVLAALVIVALLLFTIVIYAKCRLNVLLWYRNRYGELEINDGKLYDAYVSYANSTDDRKFVNFIVKPHLENRHGYKLFIDDKDILPNSEPSADLIMNVSRCRRLIVVLSNAYLEQEWCNNNFREGLWRLLELSQRPIFIAFESQYRKIAHPAINLLKQHKSAVTLLMWRASSMVPSSDFWKELCLSLPRKVSYQGLRGDPQTYLQEDKDPMLILNSNYLDFRGDSHPEGDTGVRGPIFKGSSVPRIIGPDGPPLGAVEEPQFGESQRSEIDISDLGSRNYGARTDFYCLVTEDDI
ncbi:single Ig IL-1-related receptor isoform X1 [Anolis carolinensis]|nr:PREDICTED: single Ig IL-1-related receptor isoform X1 [Anolis carolinensis]XP_008107079.1 PREDICTED: single Ig IL-1-related receptor isoform X1 [Anolis carolinensis]XP_008107085.1 PREDICTED: single Ig IL-1-related receptor isoform X1 [Anolis carolinensis]XP_008107089.1 PREDICTED: single Ig IL-1-related receptor isoform X1 [Anolis carolinensis]XP_008107093.1 PREDICTED: single Ig IL-1-related receptor isoform X1 [Anolis carolinensis]XP_008107097.1 PREDICTED: single Ig IL-1-related receptor is|eukprot:XP_008107073.1 PREDICTED: single Ig IL-1-related receptor isoform X1 [Anolis carolinensis]